MRFHQLLSVDHLVVSRWLKVATQILLMLVFATKSWAGAITYPNFESAELGRSYNLHYISPLNDTIPVWLCKNCGSASLAALQTVVRRPGKRKKLHLALCFRVLN